MSIGHLVIIFLILLLVFGPSRLEGIGSSLGKAVRGFKKGLEDGEDGKPLDGSEKKVSTLVTTTDEPKV